MNLTNPPPRLCSDPPNAQLSGSSFGWGRTAAGTSLLWGAITGEGQFCDQGCSPNEDGWSNDAPQAPSRHPSGCIALSFPCHQHRRAHTPANACGSRSRNPEQRAVVFAHPCKVKPQQAAQEKGPLGNLGPLGDPGDKSLHGCSGHTIWGWGSDSRASPSACSPAGGGCPCITPSPLQEALSG